MSKLFSDILMNDETLFRDENVLDYDYLPEKLPGREGEISVIAESIKPLFVKRKPSNLFIYGKPGIGKTACTRYVLKEVKEASNNILPLYINCWNNQTTHAAVIKLSQILGLILPPKGISTEEVIQKCLNALKQRKGSVICLDEFDRLKEHDLLYSLIELGNVAVLLITNERDYLNNLEPRLLSRLCLNNLGFNNYTKNQVMEILLIRAKQAFYPNVISREVINLISENAQGDIRRGIGLMIESGKAAEKDASKEIKDKHVNLALEKLSSIMIKELKSHNKEVYDLIKKNPGLTTGKIYDAYKKEGGDLSMRSFRRYVNNLEELGLIKADETSKGFKGKSRVLNVK